MREADLPIAGELWQDGYEDPSPEDLYAARPLLRILEANSRVGVRIVVWRDYCAEEARALVEVAPSNRIAQAVVAQARKRRL